MQSSKAKRLMGDVRALAKSYGVLSWIYQRNYAADDLRWLPVIKRLRRWHIYAILRVPFISRCQFQLPSYDVVSLCKWLITGRTINEHYRAQRALFKKAVDVVAADTGDERMGLCFWAPDCCRSEKQAPPDRCLEELGGNHAPNYIVIRRELEAEARAAIFDYIERFYNPRKRRRLEIIDRKYLHLTQQSVETR